MYLHIFAEMTIGGDAMEKVGIGRSETFVIKNPSEKVIRLFDTIKAAKSHRNQELLKKEKCTFTVQV